MWIGKVGTCYRSRGIFGKVLVQIPPNHQVNKVLQKISQSFSECLGKKNPKKLFAEHRECCCQLLNNRNGRCNEIIVLQQFQKSLHLYDNLRHKWREGRILKHRHVLQFCRVEMRWQKKALLSRACPNVLTALKNFLPDQTLCIAKHHDYCRHQRGWCLKALTAKKWSSLAQLQDQEPIARSPQSP